MTRKLFGILIACAVFAIASTGPQFAQDAPKPVDQDKDGKYALMAFVPAGKFRMGREDNRYDLLRKFPRDKDDDRPVHTVYLDAFFIDKFEVTNLEYYRFTEATGRAKPWHWVDGMFDQGTAGQPVYNVTWFDAAAYCKWMGKRLLTEAEWEKAARGGLEGKYYPHGETHYFRSGRGNDDDDDAVDADGAETKKVEDVFDQFKGNPVALYDPYRPKEKVRRPDAHFDGAFGPETVGKFAPNGYGLYDMAGNVWEWVSDWWGLVYYSDSPKENPKGLDTGIDRVFRGGSWVDGSDNITVWFRNHALPETKSPAIGIRCACDAPADKRTKSTP